MNNESSSKPMCRITLICQFPAPSTFPNGEMKETTKAEYLNLLKFLASMPPGLEGSHAIQMEAVEDSLYQSFPTMKRLNTKESSTKSQTPVEAESAQSSSTAPVDNDQTPPPVTAHSHHHPDPGASTVDNKSPNKDS